MAWSELARRAAVIGAMVLGLGVAFGLGLWLAPGDGASPEGAGQAASETTWTCSMHPQIRADEPGDCPICGMDLVPAGDPGAITSDGRIVLSERARALMGLRTTEVHRHQDPASAVRLLGRVEPAETTRKQLTTWIGGRIDRLHLATTGEQVRAGQIVATLYSPEVYQAHQDLIVARSQVERLAGGSAASQGAARTALSAARDRLALLGVPQDELDRLTNADAPTRSIPIRSPFSGTVLERVATEGAYVQTGQPLYRLADLTTVWVQLDAYESDLARLAVGQPVTLQVEALPGRTFDGRVAFVEPTVDPRRRTASVRVEVDNPDGALRPGMYATASVTAPLDGAAAPLVIPDSAPLFTGRRSVVYVEHMTDGVPAYEPRTVRLGPRLGDVYPVVSGLQAGERVVSRGAFVLDADLQIRGGPSMMTRPDDLAVHAPEPVLLSPAERESLGAVVQAYLSVQRALAEDDHPAATTAASSIEAAAAAVELPPDAAEAWSQTAGPLRTHARRVADSADIESARGAFEALSAATEALLARFGNPLDAPLHVAFCPMAMNSVGARWVQQGEVVDNAYFGDAMRRCGEIEEAVAPDAYLSPPPARVTVGPDPHAGHAH